MNTGSTRKRGKSDGPSLTRRVRKSRRSAFSLLEVILAIALLAGAIAVLGEINRLALRNAGLARDLARAQMLCESKMAEISSGIVTASDIDKASFDQNIENPPPDDAWVYSIATDSQTPAVQGVISVRVTVTKDVKAVQNPIEFSLVRWMPDPNYTPPESSSGSSGTNSSSGTSSTSSGGTSNGGTY